MLSRFSREKFLDSSVFLFHSSAKQKGGREAVSEFSEDRAREKHISQQGLKAYSGIQYWVQF